MAWSAGCACHGLDMASANAEMLTGRNQASRQFGHDARPQVANIRGDDFAFVVKCQRRDATLRGFQ